MARGFYERIKIRSNVLTESNIRALVKVVDEQMDGVAREQRKSLQTVEDELEDVKRKLGRIWHFIETADSVEMTDASDRIREHRDRQERLEDAAADARAILSQRRGVLDDVETIAAYAQDMSVFLNESELTERRAFIETFVKEVVVMPGDALVRYTVPMPDDSLIPGRDAEEVALKGSVLSTVKNGGPGATGSTRAGSVLTSFVESWFVFQACWFLHLRGFRSPFVQLRLSNKPDSRREDQPQDEYDPPVDASVRESLHCLTLLIISI